MPDEQPPEETFEILISAPGGGKCHLEARSRFLSKPVHTDIRLPSIQEWKDRLSLLQDALRLSARNFATSDATNRDAAINDRTNSPPFDPPPKIISEIGADLFSLLFAKEIYGAYTTSRDAASSLLTPLKVRLSFNAPGLSFLPWETLFDGDGHLALSPKSAVVRNSLFDEDVVLPLASLPIAVLGMVPRTRGTLEMPLKPLNVEAEQANIKAALQPLLDQDLAVLEWASGSTSDLTDRLSRPARNCSTWHVFHFCGHGGFDPVEDQGFVVVDPDPDPIGITGSLPDAAILYADDLRDALENSDGLRLVILNSCRGAMGSAGAASAAEQLVKRGFPAVIAMQFDISDRAAIMFSAVLYQHLAQGVKIHRAVTIARQRMKRYGMAEWITPVLYMRSTDGRLFRH